MCWLKDLRILVDSVGLLYTHLPLSSVSYWAYEVSNLETEPITKIVCLPQKQGKRGTSFLKIISQA